MSTLKQGKKKFDSRAQPSVFLGYPHGQKGYKVYSSVTQKILISRDVTFHEHHFPYHLTTNFSSPFSRFYLPSHTNIPNYDSFRHPLNIFSTISPNSNTPDHIQENQNIVLEITTAQDPQPLLRRSTRSLIQPSYLKDYYCQAASDATQNQWCSLIHSSTFPKQQQFLADTYIDWHEPSSYTQAFKDPFWIKAMDTELEALHHNKTWDVVPLPLGKKAIGCK